MESKDIKSKLIGCCSQQLSEIDLLTCMYPNKEDIFFSGNNVLKNMKQFVLNETQNEPNHLEFSLSLQIDSLKVKVSVILPSFYPEEEPDIYIRCNKLTQHQENAINTDLSNYIKHSHIGEPCLYTAILWIQEHFEQYSTIEQLSKCTSVNNKDQSEEKFVRLWIFSHHIYNKKKREDIAKMAKAGNLTGFCLPGKPGIICIEGTECECNEWWKIIKSMNWKKIAIRKSEIFNVSNQIKEQRFKNFEEIHFPNSSSKRSNHTDMSEFLKYLEKFRLTHAFNDFFGLCNNNS